MNISGIRTGAGFYDYNSIKINEVRSQQIQEARESEQIPVTGTVEQNDSTDAKVEQIPAAQKEDYGVADFNAKYQPDASYDLKGVDSDIQAGCGKSIVRFEKRSGIAAVSVLCW